MMSLTLSMPGYCWAEQRQLGCCMMFCPKHETRDGMTYMWHREVLNCMYRANTPVMYVRVRSIKRVRGEVLHHGKQSKSTSGLCSTNNTTKRYCLPVLHTSTCPTKHRT